MQVQQSGSNNSKIDSTMGCLERLRSGCFLIVFNLFMLLFVALFVYLANRDYQLDKVGVTTVGTVIGQEESDSGESGCCVYSPIVEFQADGQSYTFSSGFASDPPQYEIGETVTVKYDPTNPARADIEGTVLWLLWAGITVLFLVIILGINIWAIIRIIRGQPIDD